MAVVIFGRLGIAHAAKSGYQRFARFLAMQQGLLLGRVRSAGDDQLQHFFMLIPDRMTSAGLTEGHAHDASDVIPVALGRLQQQRIACGFVDRAVKGNVGLDHRAQIPATGCGPTGANKAKRQIGPTARGLAGGQSIEHGTDLIKIGDMVGGQRRHHHPAASGINHQTVTLQ